jgi:hypothetical protein
MMVTNLILNITITFIMMVIGMLVILDGGGGMMIEVV